MNGVVAHTCWQLPPNDFPCIVFPLNKMPPHLSHVPAGGFTLAVGRSGVGIIGGATGLDTGGLGLTGGATGLAMGGLGIIGGATGLDTGGLGWTGGAIGLAMGGLGNIGGVTGLGLGTGTATGLAMGGLGLVGGDGMQLAGGLADISQMPVRMKSVAELVRS